MKLVMNSRSPMTYRSPARKRFVKALGGERERGRERREVEGKVELLDCQRKEPVLVLAWIVRLPDLRVASRSRSSRAGIDRYRISIDSISESDRMSWRT